MYVFTSDNYDWAFIPICFKILNANNEGDYYNGIPVDINQIDGINYPFGNLDEPCLNSAIAFIQGLAPKYGMPSANERLEIPFKKGHMVKRSVVALAFLQSVSNFNSGEKPICYLCISKRNPLINEPTARKGNPWH